jgi:anaerobic selenocysteine-containing dehydrogenase
LIFNPPAPTEGFASRLPAASHAEWHRFAEGVRTGSSPVDALLVHRVNPLYGMPAATGIGAALEKIPFIASFSSYLDDTTLMADLILPDSSILESWGDDVPDPSPGYQTVGVQQPVVRQFYNTRGFFDGLLSISRKLGGQVASELPWGTVRDLLREDAQQLRALNRGSVPLGADFERFWVNLLQRGGWWDEDSRVTTVPAAKLQPPAAPSDAASEFAGSADEYPFYLVPFPHFTMQAGEGAHLPWLQSAPDTMTSATWQTWVELNPRTADSLQIKMFDVVRVETVVGALEASVYINPAAAPDIIAIPMGQGHRGSGRYAEGRGENVLRILAPLTDRGTGALAWCATRARISKAGKWQRVALLDRYLEGVPKSRELPDAKIIGITKE